MCGRVENSALASGNALPLSQTDNPSTMPEITKTHRDGENGGALRGTGAGRSMRRLFWLCLAFMSAMVALSAVAQQRETRLALVIGNASYPDASTPLSSTIEDARSLAQEFRRNGFEVDLKENAGKADMQRAIDALNGKIRSGSTVLFYFSGYGIQVARQTYLMPVNAQVWTEPEVRRDGINLEELVAGIHRKGAKVKIVIIDAARRNPFERRFRPSAAGLAALEAPENTLAMFSAAPGKLIVERTSANGLFASELIKELQSPNVAAEEVFNRVRMGVSRASNNEQIPWVSSSLIDEFYFGSAAKASSTDTPTRVSGTDNIPLTREREWVLKPKDTFKECAECPEMVLVSAGEFMMGSPEDEPERFAQEGPQHRVKIGRSFALGKLKVTRDQFETFVRETNYSTGDRCYTIEAGRVEDRVGRSFRNPGFVQEGNHPVVCVNWDDARAYVAWLTKKTGKLYRLASESEWEYAARAGTTTPFWWGSTISPEQANYDGNSIYAGGTKGENRQKTVGADQFKPNAWGFYQVHGNAFEWVEDCWNDSYRNAPADDSVMLAGNCTRHVRRAGAWNYPAATLRAAYRDSRPATTRGSNMSLRVARTVNP
jgi:formylglycine-generating enzyme required for sulfatase activity